MKKNHIFLIIGLTFVLGSELKGSWSSANERVALTVSPEKHELKWDLIVRYREPQNTQTQAIQSVWKTAGAKSNQVQVVNSSEGVVQIGFDSAKEAVLAQEKLSHSEDVLNVSANQFYRPAIALRWKEAKIISSALRFHNRLLPLARTTFLEDFSSSLGSPFPGVILPPSNVKVGPDPLVREDWALQNIRLPRSNKLQATRRVITAVIDTGVDYNHEDLVGGMWRHPDNPREVGYDFAHNHNKPYDVVHFDIEGCLKDAACQMGIETQKYLANPGHGTHVAGHVAAVMNNSLGMRGVGSGAPMMGLKFFYDAGELWAGSGDDAAAIQAIDYAIKNGAKVLNASWGGQRSREEAEKSELKAALIRARQAGLIVVIAAGNDGVNQDSVEMPSYPAAYDLDNLIVVAASNAKDELADFSNYGAKSVHLAAPGVKILSTIVGGRYSDLVAEYKDENGNRKVLEWDGTSMASPLVAGAVALVWSQHPRANYRQIRARVLQSARKVAGLSGRVATGGILDVASALR